MKQDNLITEIQKLMINFGFYLTKTEVKKIIKDLGIKSIEKHIEIPILNYLSYKITKMGWPNINVDDSDYINNFYKKLKRNCKKYKIKFI